MSPDLFAGATIFAGTTTQVVAQQNLGPGVLIVPLAILIAVVLTIVSIMITFVAVLRRWRQFETPRGDNRRGRWFRATFWLWVGLPLFLGMDALRIAVENHWNNPTAMQQRQDARRAANDKRYEREFRAHRQHVIAEVKRGRSIQDYEIAEYYGGERWYGGWLQELTAALRDSDPRMHELALTTFPILVAKSHSDRFPETETRAAIDELRNFAADEKQSEQFHRRATAVAGLLEKKITPGANIRLAAAKLSLIEQEFPSPTYDPRVLEAEREFQHRMGSADGDGWSATPGKDNGGHLLFGPYLKDLPPGGLHVANFRLLTSADKYGSTDVASLDVYDARINRVLASVSLTVSDFHAPLKYQEFPVPFFCDKTHDLEFRVWWPGNTYVRVDRVELRVPNVAYTEPWELQIFDHPRNFGTPSATDWQTITKQQPVARASMRNLALTWHHDTFNDFVSIATLTTDLPAGEYQLWTLAHDGVRVAFDGKPVIDTWDRNWPDSATLASAAIRLEAGKHTVRVEHDPADYAFGLYVWMERLETKPP